MIQLLGRLKFTWFSGPINTYIRAYVVAETEIYFAYPSNTAESYMHTNFKTNPPSVNVLDRSDFLPNYDQELRTGKLQIHIICNDRRIIKEKIMSD